MALIETPTPHAAQPAEARTTRPTSRRKPRGWPSLAVLFLGALVFLFPFYYMVVGSLQAKPDTSLRGAFPTGGLTLHNYAEINSRVDLGSSLVNSGIFTGGVILGTVVFGVLAGYALARLQFRGAQTGSTSIAIPSRSCRPARTTTSSGARTRASPRSTAPTT